MTWDYRGKHVLVTGASGALGKSLIDLLRVAGAELHTPAIDLTDEAAVTRAYAQIPPVWASIHLAGGFAAAPATETSLATFRAQFDTNAVTCFLCCREAVRSMRRGGAGGRIVNVAARPALLPQGGILAYTTSKAAVVSITRSLAEEVRGDGILVNAVAPSTMDTPQNRKSMPDADFTRWPKTEEVAATILHLASSENHLTSGATLPVYGRA